MGSNIERNNLSLQLLTAMDRDRGVGRDAVVLDLTLDDLDSVVPTEQSV